jgi:hypothetical protein
MKEEPRFVHGSFALKHLLTRFLATYTRDETCTPGPRRSGSFATHPEYSWQQFFSLDIFLHRIIDARLDCPDASRVGHAVPILTRS